MNEKLAIAIPTYNRPDILEGNLTSIIPVLRQHAVPVYISDDSSNDATQKMIARLKCDYEYIFYVRNSPAYGHDLNFFRTLALPGDAEYVWYLGDSVRIYSSRLEEIIGWLDCGADFIFVNSGRVCASNGDIADVRDFLEKNAWHLTLTGATIYGRGPRIEAGKYADSVREWKNFPQLGLILDFVSRHESKAYWFSAPSFETSKRKISYWKNDVVSVFASDWVVMIDSFKDFFGNRLDEVVRSHSEKSGVFKLPHLLSLRMNDGLDLEMVKAHEQDLARASATPLWKVKCIAIFPKFILRLLNCLRRAWKAE